jgi:hypothetical protein
MAGRTMSHIAGLFLVYRQMNSNCQKRNGLWGADWLGLGVSNPSTSRQEKQRCPIKRGLGVSERPAGVSHGRSLLTPATG